MNGDDRHQLELLRAEMKAEFALVRKDLEPIRERAGDHEKRIRSVERWKYSVPFGVLLGLAGIVGAIIGGK